MRSFTGFGVFALTMVLSLPALAEDSAAAESPYSSVFSFSPTHLALPVVEIAFEQRFNEAVSLTVIGGIGQVSDALYTASVFEVGCQLRYYAVDDFAGFHMGFEALYLGISMDDGATVEVAGQGLALGPLVGWKFVLDSGLTFDLQGGYQFLTMSAQGEDTVTGETASDGQSDGVPLANINVGWSF